MTQTDPVLRARAALGVASRASRGGAADPNAIELARCNLAAAKLERAVRQSLGSLTPEQRAQIASLLTGGGGVRG